MGGSVCGLRTVLLHGGTVRLQSGLPAPVVGKTMMVRPQKHSAEASGPKRPCHPERVSAKYLGAAPGRPGNRKTRPPKIRWPLLGVASGSFRYRSSRSGPVPADSRSLCSWSVALAMTPLCASKDVSALGTDESAGAAASPGARVVEFQRRVARAPGRFTLRAAPVSFPSLGVIALTPRIRSLTGPDPS